MIRIAIVDDDRNMLSIITNNIKQIPEIKDRVVLFEYTSAEDVLEQLKADTEFDIIISDIEMTNMQGIEFGEIIRKDYPGIFLIFLTAHPHYAARSYAINAHQYILKDEMEERLPVVLKDIANQIHRKQKKYRNVVKGNEIKKISYNDIIYIRKMKGAKYIQYYTRDGEYHERISLEQILEELGSERFVMIERGFIVNTEHIDAVKARTIFLDNGEVLTISRGKYAEVREKLHMCWREQV